MNNAGAKRVKPGIKPPAKRLIAAAALFILIIPFFRACIDKKAAECRPLNIILITVDTFRPDRTGCYGYKRDTTPFLDSVSQNGVLFQNVISTAPWTSPGMISIFTGMYPSMHGVDARGKFLVPGIETVFDVFKKHGYLVPDITYLTNIPNFANLGLDPKEKKNIKKNSIPGEEIIRWLRMHKEDSFFLWYHYRYLHLPYSPKKKFNIYIDESQRDILSSPAMRAVQNEVVIPAGSATFTDDESGVVADLYDGQLREMDSFFKYVFNALGQLNLNTNTLVVITADHGEELFEHGFIGHASTAINTTLYDEVLKIPLILHAPFCIDGGNIIKEPVRQIDIMPTILDIAGLPIPDDVQGVSLMPMIKGKKSVKILPAISESIMGGYQSTPETEKIVLHSIRDKDWKLIRIYNGDSYEYKLFNLKEDPEETENIFSNRTKQASRLKKELGRSIKEMQARRFAFLSKEKTSFAESDIPGNAPLEKPEIVSPKNGEVVWIDENGQIKVIWTGDRNLTYVIEYDVGKGWRSLKGKIPVQSTEKIFGPLPPEAREPLPYWNPYRIRVSPYGLEKYWSGWIEFNIETGSVKDTK